MDVSDSASSPLATACAAFASALSGDVETVRILVTLLSNLAKEDTAKFRRINLQNAKIKAAIADVAGAKEVLLACGFEAVEGGAALLMGLEDGSARAATASAALDDALAIPKRSVFVS